MKREVYRKLKMFACYSIKGFLLQILFVNLLFGMVTTDAQRLNKIKISLDINNVTLLEALNTIEQKSGVNFIYNSEEIALDDVVSLNYDDATLEEVLTKLSGEFGLSFSQLDKFIVVKKIIVSQKTHDNNAKGGIRGNIKGSDTKSPLPYAILMLEGTNNGTTTDIDGNYVLRNIEPGKRKIAVSYVGYKTKVIDVIIKPDQVTEINIVLDITSVEGEEVVVTAQRTGQQSAINEQLKSNVIANIVAPDRLQENPDANAAEAIGRLPGVSLIRSGGEGTGVVIRGLDPKYSQILLDGIPLPSSNDNTRATSINGISEYALQGVEVFKSVTSDMEGSAVAGAINLKLNEAPSGLKYSLMAQGGYNQLNNYSKNYIFQGSLSDRFFDDKLGVLLSLDAENVNRSAQTLSASYINKNTSTIDQLAKLFATGINLNDQKRINTKAAGTLVIDYRISPETKLFFTNFFSHTDQDYTGVTKSYNVDQGTAIYLINDVPDIYTEMYMGKLKAEHQFKYFELDEGISFSESHNYMPDSRNWQFNDILPGLNNYGNQAVESLPLDRILAGATDNLSTTTLNNFELYNMTRQADDMIEKHINAFFNSKLPYDLGDFISGYIKFGAEYKLNSRDRNYDDRGEGNPINLTPNWGDYAVQALPWAGTTQNHFLSMKGLDASVVDNFLKSQYNFGWYPNIDRLNQLFDWWNNFSNYYLYTNPKNMPSAFTGGKIGFQSNWPGIKWNSQNVNEYYYAGYLMGELDLGDMISFIPGVRYERVKDNLGGWWMENVLYPSSYIAPGYSTDTTHNDEYWLPNFHLKIKPTDWFQALVSATQTLNRPDYNQLMPNVYLNRNGNPQSYQSGNPDLKPELWTNYDVQLAVFGDKIGLVSLSGFYKNVKDMIWTPVIYRTSGNPWIFGNDISKYFADNSTVQIIIPQNHSFPVHLTGLEFEIQTNLWYLPEPFNYISLNANFTFINSETKYQYSYTYPFTAGYDSKGRPITKLVSVDSIYSGPMLNQPKSIANFSFGYNYKGFNLWLSYQYTGSMVTSEPNMTEFQNDVSQFAKWDLQIAQKLPVDGLEALFNYANINNPVGYQNYLADARPTYQESYGWTMSIGLRYKL